jgi:hypothetical protein
MRTFPIIGISGKARVGKDTAANFIIAAVGGYRYAFADPIKQMLKSIGVDYSDPYWQGNKDNVIPVLGVSMRQLMQTLGTDWGRDMISKDLWTLVASQNLARTGLGMVVPDVRYDNEADWVRNHGGRIIHITRAAAPTVREHASENGILVHDNDLHLTNDSSLEDLQHNVKALLNVY